MASIEIKLWPDDGATGLKTELMSILRTELTAALISALDDVGDDMRETLAKHLATDVYADSVYKPKQYERRL